eukprot:TRINITY_DN11744_c0_g2_i3.p1 TRINITY_DN11744_c0_g2~~TRINITY_DN11744_c0_g2_i3.p1  ORF type:complete len:298 (+),score=60.11 TRINITY_DN11744_c0_g2_i3:38-931(+)
MASACRACASTETPTPAMGSVTVELDEEAHEASRPHTPDVRGSRLQWLLESTRPRISWRRRCAAAGVPILAIAAAGVIAGLCLNYTYTGDAWNGSSGVIPVGGVSGQPKQQVSLNALSQALICVSIAGGMSLVRFVARNHTHPRVYGVFSFWTYLVLLLVLLQQVYHGGITVLTNPQGIAMADQIYSNLGSTFKWIDDKFATTFDDISEISDFWAFMRGPFRDFVLGASLNQINFNEGNPDAGINEPALTSIQFNPVTDHTVALGAVSYTHLRAHETPEHLVCRLLLEKKKTKEDKR